MGLQALMGALAARHKEGVSEAAVHSRWPPELATAVERGVWRRFEKVLHDPRGEGGLTR